MADERDLELLDDYLSNRLRGTERSEFERKLEADPDLQNEYVLQKALIQGIRQARAAELKAMLNSVQVPGGQSAFASKAALAIVTVLLAGTAYWFFTRDEAKPSPAVVTQKQQVDEKPSVSQPVQPETTETIVKKEDVRLRRPAPQTDKNQTSAGTENSKPSLGSKPIPVGPPPPPVKHEASDNENATLEDADISLRPVPEALVINTEQDDARYSFHYQLHDGHLVLYGPFDRTSLDLKEFGHSEKRELVLRHSGRYYLLTETGDDVKPLSAVTDPDLLEQLSEGADK